MPKKIVPIDYTSADFDKIKRDLVNYAKKYYPNTYKDFNEASFGSLMTDLVSYVGDSLSFYLDYNANESFLNTSLEYDNVLAHARQLGYKHSPVRVSVGVVDIYVPVPTDSVKVSPDINYLPRLLRGTTFSTTAGTFFTLNEDLDFYAEDVEVVGSEVSADGSSTTYYILKAKAEVVSGEEKTTIIEVGDYQRFLSVEIPGDDVTEIVSVKDSQGNEYYEVDHLSQNTIYKPFINPQKANTDRTAPSIMKAYPVLRRFVTERKGNKLCLVFGYGSESELKDNKIADPSEVSLQVNGKNYVSDNTFDPSNLLTNDKFGITPVNTSLTISYRSNNVENANAAVGTVTTVANPIVQFREEQNLDSAKVNYVVTNLQVYNEDAINGDITVPTTEEIKIRAAAQFASQGRAVTLQDYVAATYAMPQQFGSVKRAAIFRDDDDYRRNMNLYIISESTDGTLEKSNSVLKKNLKTWLNSVRMVNDSIDILDAKIANIGVEFDVIARKDANKNAVFNIAKDEIYKGLTEIKPEIGEPFYITDIFRILKEVDEVLDVVNVKVVSKSGSSYSSASYDVETNLSPEGRVIYIPHDFVWEVKFQSDISGTVR